MYIYYMYIHILCAYMIYFAACKPQTCKETSVCNNIEPGLMYGNASADSNTNVWTYSSFPCIFSFCCLRVNIFILFSLSPHL